MVNHFESKWQKKLRNQDGKIRDLKSSNSTQSLHMDEDSIASMRKERSSNVCEIRASNAMEREVIEILMPESIASISIEHSGLQESLTVAQRDESHPEGASMDQLSNVTVGGLLHSTCRNKSNSKMKTVGVECKTEVKEEESKGSSIGRGKTTKGEHNPQTDVGGATVPNHFSSIHRGSGTEKYRVNGHRPLLGNGTLKIV